MLQSFLFWLEVNNTINKTLLKNVNAIKYVLRVSQPFYSPGRGMEMSQYCFASLSLGPFTTTQRFVFFKQEGSLIRTSLWPTLGAA